MDRQVQGRQDEDDFFERLQRAVQGPLDVTSDSLRPNARSANDAGGAPAPPLVTTRGAGALQDLGARIAELERQVQQLNEHYDQFVSDVADAVVARLDARWARSLTDDSQRTD